ncbi:hypothetical protein B7P02_15495 [Bordetella bronchiseptica]|uniref:hypothetical protein n=1 Tax=Bordetella bronchiseptica TaxID=518 RepID=UPI000D737CD9|nr:hypothetical protein [Bordetella bronchiseptica]AWP59331.1 hypothetical protein B7P02_15495 [Bordetella bronchiseptica]
MSIRFRTVVNAGVVGCVGLLALAGCGESADRDADVDAAIESAVRDEDRVMREAAENRKRFLGDGKAQYTPHAVEGF